MNTTPFRLLPLVAITMGLIIFQPPALGDPISATEVGKQTMSKFMMHLARFVTWPDSRFSGDAAPYRYCLMGDDPFFGTLDSAATDTHAKKREFDIQNLSISDIDSAKNSHVVFLNLPMAMEAIPVINSLAGLPILTVGEVDQFAQHGGMVGFLKKGRRIALAINQKRLERAGLKASSRLYRASNM